MIMNQTSKALLFAILLVGLTACPGMKDKTSSQTPPETGSQTPPSAATQPPPAAPSQPPPVAAGWSQTDKDSLIGPCVDKAKAGAPSLDETKLKNYCSCYQQNLEKKYPTIEDLAKANMDDVAKEAEKCISIITQ